MKKKSYIPNIVISLMVILNLSAAFYLSKDVIGSQANKAVSGSNTQENKIASQSNETASGSGGQSDETAPGSVRQGDGTASDSGGQGDGTVSDRDGQGDGTASDSGGQENIQNRQQDAQNEIQEKKKIALTFDDGPDAEYTPQLLDGLAKRGVKVTFFVIGKQAEEQPELMQRIVKEGHLIGNHTYNHVDIRNMTESAAKEEIKKANEIIEKFTGEEPSFLRPPFGSGSNKLEKEMEMIQVLWTIDTMDWSCQNEAKICSTVYKEIEENSIILMHDEYPTTVRAAFSIIDELQKQGYEFVTVDEIVLG